MVDQGDNNDTGPTGVGLTPEEHKKRKQRNLATAAALVGFIILVFFVTMLRLGGSIAEGAL